MKIWPDLMTSFQWSPQIIDFLWSFRLLIISEKQSPNAVPYFHCLPILGPSRGGLYSFWLLFHWIVRIFGWQFARVESIVGFVMLDLWINGMMPLRPAVIDRFYHHRYASKIIVRVWTCCCAKLVPQSCCLGFTGSACELQFLWDAHRWWHWF